MGRAGRCTNQFGRDRYGRRPVLCLPVGSLELQPSSGSAELSRAVTKRRPGLSSRRWRCPRARQRRTASLRRQLARIVGGRIQGGYTDAFELTCPAAATIPAWIAPRSPLLGGIREPRTLEAGIAEYK